MSIRIRVNADLGLVVVTFSGVVTAEEFLGRLSPLVATPEIGLLPLALFDLRPTLRLEIPTRMIRDQASRASGHIDHKIGAGAKMAVVASRDEYFGLGRMYQALRDDSPVELGVFRSIEPAEEWLGLTEGYEDQLADFVEAGI